MEWGDRKVSSIRGHCSDICWLYESVRAILFRFVATLRGHVQRVYQVSWSADSRLLVSGSQDSTLKLWEVKSRRLTVDLPGHADDVYTVDWSPDGQRVVSGGKDKVLKL